MTILAFLGNLGWTEIIVIAFLALLLFGGKKLPSLAKDLGQGIREFRKSLFNPEEEESKTNKTEIAKEEPEEIPAPKTKKKSTKKS